MNELRDALDGLERELDRLRFWLRVFFLEVVAFVMLAIIFAWRYS